MPRPLLHSLILVAAVFLLYRPALNYTFVWDDTIYVVQNPAVQHWSHAPAAFTSPHTTWSSNPQYNLPAWRPLRNISYLLDHSLYALNPTGWHLTNIILHAAAAVLLYLLILRLMSLGHSVPRPLPLPHTLAALAGAAFWALHPVQTEVVAWVKSRDDLLATVFFFAALLLALPRRSTEPLKPAAMISALILFLCALLSKENTIILAGLYPLILALYAPPRLRSFSSADPLVRNPLSMAIKFVIAALVFLVIRHQVLGRTGQVDHLAPSPLSMLLTMLYAFARYTRLILWPWPPTIQSADYDAFPIITSTLHPGALTGAAVLFSLLIILAVMSFRARSTSIPTPSDHYHRDDATPRLGTEKPQLSSAVTAAIGLAFFLLALLPFANIIPMMQILAERFLYLPLAGLAMVLASCFLFLAFPSRLCAFASKFAIFTIIAALAIQTHRRLPVWTNELTLFADTRRANPTSWRPADQYVKALLKDQQTTAALQAANTALRQFPRDPDIVRTAALTHLLAGHETTGTLLTQYAIRLQPNDQRASQTLEKWKRLRWLRI